MDLRRSGINVQIQRAEGHMITLRGKFVDECLDFWPDLWRVCVCVFLSEISDCGHDVRGVGQSNRKSGYRLQMEQRHVCVNLGEYYGAAHGHRWANNEHVLTESLLYLLSSSVYPVHQLVSALTLLFQVQLQLCDPVLYKQSSVSPVTQSVSQCCCLNRWLWMASIFTSISLTCRAFSSLELAFVSASPSRSWRFFSSAFTLSTAWSRSLWHCCSSPSCCDNCRKTHQQSVTHGKPHRLIISALELDVPGLAPHNGIFCNESEIKSVK